MCLKYSNVSIILLTALVECNRYLIRIQHIDEDDLPRLLECHEVSKSFIGESIRNRGQSKAV